MWSHAACKKRMTEHVQQGAWPIHILVSLLEDHWQSVIFFMFFRLSSSHSCPINSFNVSWIFLANISMLLHQRFWVFSSTKVTAYFSVFTFLWMAVKLKQSLHISAKWTWDSLLTLALHWFLFHVSQILFYSHVWIRVRLSPCLNTVLRWYFNILRLYMSLWILWNPARSEFWHSLAPSLMDQKVWGEYVSATWMAISCRLFVFSFHASKIL